MASVTYLLEARMERASWKRTLPELLSASNSEIVAMLEEDGLLPKWRGKVCPHCWKGTLTSTTRNNAPQYRCTANKCTKFVLPHHLHPLFNVSSGQSHKPLQLQAALLLLRLTGVKTTSALRRLHVEKLRIRFGGMRTWQDVEADEATFARQPQQGRGKKCVLWEQWSGLVQRGKPKTLVLNRLNPPMTVKNAPGPGAIRKVDWLPFGRQALEGSQGRVAHGFSPKL